MAAAWTDTVDTKVREAVSKTWPDIAGGRVCLVAVGSYGRRELAPHSDVDVLILHDLRHRHDVEELTKAVLYPLWDASLELGYAVRSIAECQRSAREDSVIATTLCDTRFVSGDAGLLDDLDSAMAKWRERHFHSLERSLLTALSTRYLRHGDAGVDLEPNIKEGRGGLRDLHLLRWLGVSDDLDEAADRLLAIRFGLHEIAGRREDKILRDRAAPLANKLGLAARDSENQSDPRDALLYAVFNTCRPIGMRLAWHATATLRPPKRRRAVPKGFSVVNGRLHRQSPLSPVSDPQAPLQAATVIGDIAGSPDLVTWARSGLHEPIPWTDESKEAFLALLRTGTTAGWEFLDVTGLWCRYIPEMTQVRAKAQYNPLHRLAVDAHCWEVVTQVLKLGCETGLIKDVYSELEQPDLLLLAGLLHDLGKGMGVDHSRQGVIAARRVCYRMGFGATTSETVAFLIANHLVLPDFATGRDLSDEDLVCDLGTRISDPERLRLLYLLSVADCKATGPAAWSDWKADLMAELYLKLARVLQMGDLVSRDARNKFERARANVLRSVDHDAHEQAAIELDGFPRRYLLSQPIEAVLTHLDLIRKIRAEPDRGALIAGRSDYVAVVSLDRPGLLAIIAGVCCTHGITIHTAEAYTRSDGIAVDALGVVGPAGHPVRQEKWPQVAADLAAALRGELDLAAAVSERAMRYDTIALEDRNKVLRDTNVSVAPEGSSQSSWYTVIEVRGPDRVGLLYDITSVLFELDLDVHFARVATEARIARDSFSVRDRQGARLANPLQIEAEIKKRLATKVQARPQA